MASKLEAAKAAIAELKKAADAGEDVTKPGAVQELSLELVAAQSAATLQAVQTLTKAIEDLKKPPVVEDKDEKPEETEEQEETDEKKSSVLLDLALEEIVRLKNAEDAPEDKKEFPPKKEDEKEEMEKAEGASEPGPQAKLEKPESDDYSDSAEKKGGGVENQEGGKKVVISKAELDAMVNKQAEATATRILKSAGYSASRQPVTPIVGETREIGAGTADADIVKSFDKFVAQDWKTINRFRMQVDPSLRNLGQPGWYTGGGR